LVNSKPPWPILGWFRLLRRCPSGALLRVRYAITILGLPIAANFACSII
jgi:hypothetical protein